MIPLAARHAQRAASCRAGCLCVTREAAAASSAAFVATRNDAQFRGVASAATSRSAAPAPVAAAVSSKPIEELYMRELPPLCIDWNSEEGRSLFRAALLEGSMECYYPLAAQFTTQADPAYCGLGTLAMVLNALNIDPGRVWKGPWRWYHESMLDCCVPLSVVQQHGISLDTFACLARCNGAAATVVRVPPLLYGDATDSPPPHPHHTIASSFSSSSSSSPPPPANTGNDDNDDEGVARFRAAVMEACNTRAGSFLVAAYSRRALGQTGSGHYSPVAAYHSARDLVLIMDVARFKYPPHWVPLKALYRAMRSVDTDTGKARGYVTVRRSASVPLVLFAFGNGAGGEAAARRLGLALPSSISSSVAAATGTAGAAAAQSSCAPGCCGGNASGSSSSTTTTTSSCAPTSASSSSSSCGSCDMATIPGGAVAASSSSSGAGATGGVGNCRGQGRNIPGAADHLRIAAGMIERAELKLTETSARSSGGGSDSRQQQQQQPLTSEEAGLSSSSSSLAALWPAAVESAVEALVLPPPPSPSSSSSSSATSSSSSSSSSSSAAASPAAASGVPMHVEAGAYSSSSSSALLADGAECMTRLSREQVASAAQLLAELEGTLLYRHVRRALEKEKMAGDNGAGGGRAQSGKGGVASARSALMAAADHHAGDEPEAAAAGGGTPHDYTPSVAADAAGGTVATLVASSSSTSQQQQSCGHQAMACVRVHTAHIVTMLLLTLYAPEAAAATATAAAVAATAAGSQIRASDALRSLVATTLGSASSLVRSEVSLLRGQMNLAAEWQGE